VGSSCYQNNAGANSPKSTLETEDHFLRAEHIDPINVVSPQVRSTHDSAQPLKGTPPYSCSEGELTKAEHLLQWHAENGNENIFFTDKKIFTIEEQYNHQNNKIYAETSHEVKENIPRVQGGHHPS
jgi:hypothetical protein